MPDRIGQVERDITPDAAADAAPPASRTPASPSPLTLRARVLGGWGATLLRLQRATWRTRVEGLAELDRIVAGGVPVLLVFWHGKYLPLFPLLQGREACVFTTRSFRGQVISEVGRHFGFEGVQLADDGEARSFVQMRRALMARRAGAIAVDGPLGPYHVAKPGVIQLASRLGCVLMPAATASRRTWVQRRRWDRMERPLPFTKVALVLGPPLSVPRDLSQREVAGWQERVREALEAAERTAREIVEGG